MSASTNHYVIEVVRTPVWDLNNGLRVESGYKVRRPQNILRRDDLLPWVYCLTRQDAYSFISTDIAANHPKGF